MLIVKWCYLLYDPQHRLHAVVWQCLAVINSLHLEGNRTQPQHTRTQPEVGQQPWLQLSHQTAMNRHHQMTPGARTTKNNPCYDIYYVTWIFTRPISAIVGRKSFCSSILKLFSPTICCISKYFTHHRRAGCKKKKQISCNSTSSI